MLQFTYIQLFVLMFSNTMITAFLLITGIDMGYRLLNNKKPIKNNVIPEISLPIELQPTLRDFPALRDSLMSAWQEPEEMDMWRAS